MRPQERAGMYTLGLNNLHKEARGGPAIESATPIMSQDQVVPHPPLRSLQGLYITLTPKFHVIDTLPTSHGHLPIELEQYSWGILSTAHLSSLETKKLNQGSVAPFKEDGASSPAGHERNLHMTQTS